MTTSQGESSGHACVDIAEPKRLGTKCQVFKQAVAENEAYIAGETQAVAIKWAAAADGLEANDADGEAFSFTTVKA